jgi:hypothetical protein
MGECSRMSLHLADLSGLEALQELVASLGEPLHDVRLRRKLSHSSDRDVAPHIRALVGAKHRFSREESNSHERTGPWAIPGAVLIRADACYLSQLLIVFLPGPPLQLSLPAPPARRSLPAPPRRVSPPAPPFRTSLPAPPRSVSLPGPVL